MYLDFSAEPNAHALHAGDLLIASLYSLNATDAGYGQRPDTLMGRLAIQEAGSPFQLLVDALRGILRALSEEFDPDGITLDVGLDCVWDIMGESNATRSVIALMRDRHASFTAVDND